MARDTIEQHFIAHDSTPISCHSMFLPRQKSTKDGSSKEAAQKAAAQAANRPWVEK